MKIIFFGTPHFVIPILKVLKDNFQIVGIVTAPDAIAGRKKILTPSPVKQFAQNHNIPVLTPKSLKISNLIRQLADTDADLFIIAAYGKIIPKEILNIPHLGAINIHPSLLPKYRGTSPTQTAILNGDETTGITFINMDEKMDHGPIIAQKIVRLKGDETYESLNQQLFQKAADMLPATMQQFSNKTLRPTSQDDTKATYCKKLAKEDGYFDIDNPPSPEKLNRMIRAYYPWPTAWTRIHLGGGRLQRSGSHDSHEVSVKETKIIKFLPGKRIQIEGGKPMSVKDFLNGYPQWKEELTWLPGLVEKR